MEVYMNALTKNIVGENGIGYTLRTDGRYYPNLLLPEMPDYEIGRYGMLRKRYLMEYRKCFYYDLLTSCKLMEHLHEIDMACMEQMELLVEQMKVMQGISEQLKERDMIEWVGRMNQVRSDAEEMVLKDFIYE